MSTVVLDQTGGTSCLTVVMFLAYGVHDTWSLASTINRHYMHDHLHKFIIANIHMGYSISSIAFHRENNPLERASEK
jgi:hypothetical protein